MPYRLSRLAVLSTLAAAVVCAGCDRKPSNPPKPSTHDSSTAAEPRPVDLRLMT